VLGKPSVELKSHSLSQGVGFRDDRSYVQVSVLLLLIHTSRSEVLLQFLSQEGELEVIVILSEGEVLESLWEGVVVVKGQVF
jgi:hypothetical protein